MSRRCTTQSVATEKWQNNYLVAEGGKCTENQTCSSMGGGTSNGYRVGCCMSGAASMNAYTKATFGTGVNTVTWVIFSDTVCKNYVVASDSQMTTSLDTARCNPQTDGTTKTFTYNATALAVTSSQFASKDCSGNPINSTIQQSDFGKCITLGSISLQAYSTIDSKTYGLPADSGATVTLGLASIAVSLVASYFAHF
ncbi:hypothetical protein Poli38472_004810 [Pythium oligandrum]|uniref:Uncharacterized protein n=1 Tax=Pythium oligandrum TaxID=41045 RepID=A0A8K1CB63_PYTOL|nr:hypothetical protein Poli38472_004810 [Pythium oligandrum]|eukprot:TMW59741.1 hypothetical protein Poli38472_004810 [Pythium oligandrum]